MTPVRGARREFVDRQSWELAGPAMWVRIGLDTQGYIELRVQSLAGQDLWVLDTAGGRPFVKVYEPHLPGQPPLGGGRRR